MMIALWFLATVGTALVAVVALGAAIGTPNRSGDRQAATEAARPTPRHRGTNRTMKLCDPVIGFHRHRLVVGHITHIEHTGDEWAIHVTGQANDGHRVTDRVTDRFTPNQISILETETHR